MYRKLHEMDAEQDGFGYGRRPPLPPEFPPPPQAVHPDDAFLFQRSWHPQPFTAPPLPDFRGNGRRAKSVGRYEGLGSGISSSSQVVKGSSSREKSYTAVQPHSIHDYVPGQSTLARIEAQRQRSSSASGGGGGQVGERSWRGGPGGADVDLRYFAGGPIGATTPTGQGGMRERRDISPVSYERLQRWYRNSELGFPPPNLLPSTAPPRSGSPSGGGGWGGAGLAGGGMMRGGGEVVGAGPGGAYAAYIASRSRGSSEVGDSSSAAALAIQAERRKRAEAEAEDAARRRHGYLPNQSPALPSLRYDDGGTAAIQRPKSPAASVLARLAAPPTPAAPSPHSLQGGGQTPSSSQAANIRGVAKALYTFKAHNAKELGFEKGDIVRIRKKVDGNWYEAESGGRVGICPVSYVELAAVADGDEGFRYTSISETSEGLATAAYNFKARNVNELSLSKGQSVALTKKVDDNWYEGRGENGRLGIFPANYVQVIREPSSRAETTLSPLNDAPPPPSSSLADLITGRATPKRNGAGPSSSSSTAGGGRSLDVAAAQLSSMAMTSGSGGGGGGALNADTYKALFPYSPANPDELELRQGDIVYVVEQCDDGWHIGTSLRTGLFGTFPGNYVEKTTL